MSTERWVSLPAAAEATGGGGITTGYTGLPVGLDPESIELNVEALQRGVIGWGGFDSMTLAAYQGDADTYSAMGSADESGIGYVSAAAVSRAESWMNSAASDKERNARDIRNGSLGVQWNINALNSRLSVHEQYDPKIRAKQLNREVKRAAIAGVWAHNTTEVMGDKPAVLTAIQAGADGLFFVRPLIDDLVREHFVSAASNTAIRAVIIMTLIRRLRMYQGNEQYNFKDIIVDPLLFPMRPTRAAIGAGTLATSRLVRAAKSE